MNREEILQASRNENKNKDLAELEVVYQASVHAARVGALVCCMVSALSSALAHAILYSPWVIYFSIFTTQWLVRFLKIRRRSDLVLAIFFFSFAVLAFVGLVFSKGALELMGTPEDVIGLSTLYMQIYFMGMPFFMLYNYGAAILRAVGTQKDHCIF